MGEYNFRGLISRARRSTWPRGLPQRGLVVYVSRLYEVWSYYILSRVADRRVDRYRFKYVHYQ